jgi:hypothetical protein
LAQKGTQSLPDDDNILPKHVGAIVKNKEVYNPVHLLVNLYIFQNKSFDCEFYGLAAE